MKTWIFAGIKIVYNSMCLISDMLRLKSTENLDQNGFNVGVLGKLAELFKTSLEEVGEGFSSVHV